MPNKPVKKAKSKAQARLFGIIAGGGELRDHVDMSPAKAKEKLKGVKYKDLPEKAGAKKKKK